MFRFFLRNHQLAQCSRPEQPDLLARADASALRSSRNARFSFLLATFHLRTNVVGHSLTNASDRLQSRDLYSACASSNCWSEMVCRTDSSFWACHLQSQPGLSSWASAC